MFRLIVALAALTLVAVPATADAKTLRGKTSQGKKVTLVLDANGVPKRMRIGWSARCNTSAKRARSTSTWFRPFDQATPDMIQDADTDRDSFEGGLKVRNRGTLAGQRAGETWSGTFTLHRQFARKGKVIGTCATPNITWSVS